MGSIQPWGRRVSHLGLAEGGAQGQDVEACRHRGTVSRGGGCAFQRRHRGLQSADRFVPRMRIWQRGGCCASGAFEGCGQVLEELLLTAACADVQWATLKVLLLDLGGS